MEGDQLYPPLNAPPGMQTPVGVQPGVQSVEFARFLLVFGPSGAVSGVFVYQPGTTPGPGNPPVISITESATDPFGNTVDGGVTVGLPTSTQIRMQSVSGAGVLDFITNNASFNDAQISSFVAGLFVQTLFFGPSKVGHVDLAGFELNSSDGTGSANGQLVYKDLATNLHFPMTWDSRGLVSGVASINAVAPTTGSLGTPAQSETPHAATLKNGWTGSGKSYNGAFFWTDSDITASPVGTTGQLHIAFDLNPPAGVGANSVFMTLPAAWIPQTDQDVGGIAWNNPQPNNSASLPWVNINNVTGDVQMTGIEANVNMWAHIVVPFGTL